MPWKLFLNFQSNNEITGMGAKRIENLTGNFYLFISKMTADFSSASRGHLHVAASGGEITARRVVFATDSGSAT